MFFKTTTTATTATTTTTKNTTNKFIDIFKENIAILDTNQYNNWNKIN